MSSEELDTFRSELLRQKIIFEAELRRQRETFAERLATVTQELAAREADCRNLQSVITVLGRKLDAVAAQVAAHSTRRPSTPTRQDLLFPLVGGADDVAMGRPASARRAAPASSNASAAGGASNAAGSVGNRFIRRPSPLISIMGSSSPAMVLHRVSSLSALSNTSTPSRPQMGAAAQARETASVESESAAAGTRIPAASGGHPNGSRLHRTSAHDEDANASSGGARAGALHNPSPRSVRVVRRTSSLKSDKSRTGSAHRLLDLKASDNW